MSIITKTSAKNYFLTGNFPTQGQFADTIDSYLGLGETSLQTVQGAITVSGALNAAGGFTTVSAQVTNTMLATMTINTIKSNISGTNAADNTLTSLFDAILGVTAGRVPLRGTSTWAAALPTAFKYITTSHDTSVAGTQAITGVGFAPQALICVSLINSTNQFSVGIADSSTAGKAIGTIANNQYGSGIGASFMSSTAGSVVAAGTIQSWDSDGITLNWMKTGSPTGLAELYFLFLR